MFQDASVESNNTFEVISPKDIRKTIVKLAWPSITEQILVMLVGVFSMIFVGRISKEAMVAVGMVNSLLFFFQAVFAALATGTTVVVARLYGEEDKASAKIAVIQALVLTFISSVLIVIPGYVFRNQLIGLFFGKAESAVIEMAVVYYNFIIISIPFVLVSIIINGAFRGAGDTRTPMVVTTLINVINITSSVILIFGVNIGGVKYLEGFGVVGAGAGALLSRAFGGILTLIILFFGKRILKLSIKEPLKVDFPMMGRILHVGLPASLEQVVMQGGFLIMQTILVSLGTVPTAVYQISMNVNSLAFMPIFGFSVAVTTLVSQSLGRKNRNEAEKYGRETARISIILISSLGAVIFIFSRQLMMLYTTDVEVINLGSSILKVFAFIEPALGLASIYSSVLRGAGDILYTTLTTLVGLWSCRIGVGILLHKLFGWGIYGIWIGVGLDFYIRAFMYLLRFRKGRWKFIKV